MRASYVSSHKPAGNNNRTIYKWRMKDLLKKPDPQRVPAILQGR